MLMFCANCGAAMNGEALAACVTCGKTPVPALTGADVGRAIKEASSDALQAIRQVAADPIAGLATSFAALGERRGRSAGVAFGVAFALLTAFAGEYAVSKLGAEAGVKALFALFVTALVPFVAIAATSTGARKVFGGTGTAGADIFTAGIALQPMGIFFVLAAVLGTGNFEVIALLLLFAWTYMLCILFTGSTRLAGVPERFAPLVVSVMLLAAMWLTKIAVTSLLGPSSPIGRYFT
jgi:hypothetical protein